MTIKWNLDCYKRQRSIAEVTELSPVTRKVVLRCTEQNIVAEYFATGSISIDATDLVRLASNGTFTIEGQNAAGTITDAAKTLLWRLVADDINPRTLYIPDATGVSAAWLNDVTHIVPPSVVYMQSDNATQFEATNIRSSSEFYAILADGGEIAGEVVGNSILFDDSDIAKIHTREEGTTIHVKPQLCDNRYVAIDWRGHVGGRCVLTWRMMNYRLVSAGSIEVQTIDNSYDIRKGREYAFTARLDGLTAYDVWYYSSIVTSDIVRVRIGNKWYDAKVTTNNVQIPNGNAGGLHTLLIDITFARYDTI